MRFFISYSHADMNIAESAYKLIERCGFKAVRDEKEISGGQIVEDRVKQLLSQSQVVIPVISPASLKSSWVFYEIGRADAAGTTIVPLLTHPALLQDLPDFLRKRKVFKSIAELRKYLKDVRDLTSSDGYVNSLRMSGLEAVYKSRASIPDYFWHFAKDANFSVRAMFVSGMFLGAVTLENAFRTKGNVAFRMLLFNPKDVDLRNRDLEGANYRIEPDEWSLATSKAREFENVTVRLYDEYPFWHLMIVDDRFCVVSHNPIGKLGYRSSPVYVFSNNQLEGNLFDVFCQYYEIIWRDSSPIS